MKMKFCVACFSDKNLHNHHVIPVSDGGTDCQTNLITLCGSCHGKIHNIKNKNAWPSHSQLTKRGIEKQKEKGVILGRPRKTNDNQRDDIVKQLLLGMSVSAMAKEYGVSRATIIGIRDSKI